MQNIKNDIIDKTKKIMTQKIYSIVKTNVEIATWFHIRDKIAVNIIRKVRRVNVNNNIYAKYKI
jgi:hypothetical protein